MTYFMRRLRYSLIVGLIAPEKDSYAGNSNSTSNGEETYSHVKVHRWVPIETFDITIKYAS